LAICGGEDAVAVMAPPELDGLQLFVAFAFAGNMQAMAVEAALALLAEETVMSMGHVFLVPQSTVLDKGTSRIVHLVGEYGLLDAARMAPHGFRRGMGGFGC